MIYFFVKWYVIPAKAGIQKIKKLITQLLTTQVNKVKDENTPNIKKIINKINRKEIDAQLGNTVRCIRKSNKVSLSFIAKSLGLTYQQMQKYETGNNSIKISTLIEICKIIGVKPSSVIKNIEDDEGASCDCLFSINEYMKYLEVKKLIDSLFKVISDD